MFPKHSEPLAFVVNCVSFCYPADTHQALLGGTLLEFLHPGPRSRKQHQSYPMGQAEPSPCLSQRPRGAMQSQPWWKINLLMRPGSTGGLLSVIHASKLDVIGSTEFRASPGLTFCLMLCWLGGRELELMTSCRQLAHIYTICRHSVLIIWRLKDLPLASL